MSDRERDLFDGYVDDDTEHEKAGARTADQADEEALAEFEGASFNPTKGIQERLAGIELGNLRD